MYFESLEYKEKTIDLCDENPFILSWKEMKSEISMVINWNEKRKRSFVF